MNNFKVGETVVCIKEGLWLGINTGVVITPQPNINNGDELVIMQILNSGALRFLGHDHPNPFHPRNFIKKTEYLSMTYTKKHRDERKVLILNN